MNNYTWVIQKVKRYVAHFVYLYLTAVMFLIYEKFDSICIRENTHQRNRNLHLTLLSNHRMAVKTSSKIK